MILDPTLEAALRFGHDRSGSADGATQVMDALRGGTFELVRSDNHILAKFVIAGGSISPDGDWRIDFAHSDAIAQASGRAVAAQLRDANGKIRITGLACGMGSEYPVQIDNSQINQGKNSVSLGETILSFPAPPVAEVTSTVSTVRILDETRDLIAVAIDIEGGYGPTRNLPPGLPQMQYRGEVHVMQGDIKWIRYLAKGESYDFEIERGVGPFPLCADPIMLPWFDACAEALSKAKPDLDFGKQCTLVLLVDKHDQGTDLDPTGGGLTDLLLAIREANEEADAAERAERARPKPALMKPVARQKTEAEIADDRWVDEFFRTVLESREE